jgi:hypothetical protein
MNITPVINAVIALLAALVTAFLVPWIKSKVGAQNMDQLLTWVDIGVAAAEQLYNSTDAREKKQYVLDFLKAKGYTVNTEDVENAVEAAVLRLHNELYGSEKVSDGGRRRVDP